MTVLHHEIEIGASVEAVWKALADLQAVRHYNPTVLSVRPTGSTPTGVGAGRHCTLKPKGFTQEEVDAWEQGRRLGIRLVASSWPMARMRWDTTIEPAGDRTRMRQVTEYRVRFGLMGRVLDAMAMRRRLQGTIASAMEAFARYVEGERVPRMRTPS